MAELAAGPHATDDAAERARRQDRLQRAEAGFHPLPFDSGPRAVDLLIAATAMAAGLPLYTRNLDDFRGLEDLVTIVGV